MILEMTSSLFVKHLYTYFYTSSICTIDCIAKPKENDIDKMVEMIIDDELKRKEIVT